MLAGSRALIIGAGSGIGRAVAVAFAREGASIGALELDPAKSEQLQTDVSGAVVRAGDAASWADCREVVAATVDEFGGLDVLVNCVGVFDFYRGLRDLSETEIDAGFDEAFRLNVKTQLVPAKVALPELTRSRGSIILTVSTSGFYPGRGGVLYVSTKFAVRGLVVALASELAPDVRVNGVAPGGTLGTDLRGFASLGLDNNRLDDTPGRAESLVLRTPLAVALTADDHAGSYVFLASAAARGMTGTFLHPDGGIAVKT